PKLLRQEQRRRPQDYDVIAEVRRLDLDLGCQHRQRAHGDLSLDRVGKRPPEAGHATRDHNPLDAQAGRHARHARTEVLPGLLDQPGDALVPGVERLQQHRRVDLLQRGGEAVYRRGWVLPRHLPHAPDERPAADERLQTAAVAAATWLPAGVDDDVPDLPCAEVVAEVQLPVEHDPRADAAPDLDHDQVRRVLAAAKAHLGE